MIERDNRSLRLTMLCLLALVLVSATAPAFAEQEENAEWKPVTVLYMSDVKGKIEPCG